MSNFSEHKWQYQLWLLSGLFCLLPIASAGSKEAIAPKSATNSTIKPEKVYILRSGVNTSKDYIHISEKNGKEEVLLFTNKTAAEKFSKEIQTPNFPPFQAILVNRQEINQFCQETRSSCKLVTTHPQLAQRTRIIPENIPTDTTPTPTPTPTPISPTPTPTPTDPTPTPTPTVKPLLDQDLKLLSKAASKFWQSNRYESTSQMTLIGKLQGIEIKAKVKIKTIVETGNKYRSEITFDRGDGKPGASYQIISNGAQVWIYRPDLKQYSQLTPETFNDSFWIGISSSLFLSLPENLRQSLLSEANSNNNIFTELQGIDPKQFQVENRQLEGKEFTTYIYKDPKQGFTMLGYVDPNNADITEIQLSGTYQGIDITMTEKIQQRIPSPKVTNKTFTFTPTRGIKKVKKLEIEPF